MAMKIGKWLLGASLAACVAGAAQAQVVERPVAPLKIDSGMVAGQQMASGVKTWFGIPFAAPPLRENRWREPQPVKAWNGVFNADRKAPECIQPLRSADINHYFGNEATSEDCLYLNIWAPASANANAKLPVVVWLYGGGLRVGSSGMAVYDGDKLAEKGVVYVNLNYRVGALGFMAHPELTAESPHKASGNYGFLDQVAALQWVKRNIAAFGGDPSNVTISGQSGGSRSVSVLVASPLAKGLFQKAQMMSGSTLNTWGQGVLPTRAQLEPEGVKLQQILKAKTLAAMRAVSGDLVVAAQDSIRSGASVDGYFLPEAPSAIVAKGAHNDVPMIMEFTRDESQNTMSRAANVAAYKAAAQSSLGKDSDAFLKLFPASTDAQAKEQGSLAGQAVGMGGNMRGSALNVAAHGKAPVYFARFSRVQPYTEGVYLADHDPKTAGAYHMGDVPYWFTTFDAFNQFRETRTWTATDRALTETMSTALINFAKTGTPSAPGMPAWPRFTAKDQRAMDFGDKVSVISISPKQYDFMANRTLANQPRQQGGGS